MLICLDSRQMFTEPLASLWRGKDRQGRVLMGYPLVPQLLAAVNRNRNWESTFIQWASPPAKTEQDRCENGVRAIRNAIAESDKLRARSIKVFSQGSYRNRVNVRKESDVDIGVLCYDSFTVSYPPGTSDMTFGNIPATYTYAQFKNELEEALVAYFGRASTRRGNKAFDIRENSRRVDADVVPFCEHRDYHESGNYRAGVALISDSGLRTVNYPERLLSYWPQTEQRYENAVAKNDQTHRRFKGVVRILKSLRNEMDDGDFTSAKPIPGFLLECMVWNAPNACFGHSTWDGDMQSVMLHLWSNTKDGNTCKDWREVDDIKYLFHVSQPWTQEQAHTFINDAWNHIGVR